MLKRLSTIGRKLRRHGFLNIAYAHAFKMLESALGLKVLRGVCVERPVASFLQCRESYVAGFLAPIELRHHALQPANEMSLGFVEQAIARGDQCYAVRDGEALAAYGWYSFGNTPVGLGNLVLNFSREYVYMYKGFTHIRYRGQRLHAVGMTRALEHYLGRGYKGLVSYVEAANLDSLKSCLRMGYTVFGSIYVLRLFGATFAVSSPGCRPLGFRLARAPAGPSVSVRARTGQTQAE